MAEVTADSWRAFLLSDRCQKFLKWTAGISAVGEVVTLGI